MTTFISAADVRREDAICQLLARAWQVEVHRFAPLSPLDAWLERARQCVAFAELKSYPHASDAYGCAWLDISKYVPLVGVAIAMSVPGLYVCAFTDRTLWADVRKLAALTPPIVTGRTDRPGVRLDREPAIRIPIEAMHILEEGAK